MTSVGSRSYPFISFLRSHSLMSLRGGPSVARKSGAQARRVAVWLLEFGDAVLRGYAQIYFCNHRGTGMLFLAGTALVFPRGALYALGGLFISTATAYGLRQARELIRNGLFGYNGALVGLGWAWFYWDTAAVSLSLFAVTVVLTVVVETAWLKGIESGQLLLPALSVPFLAAMWVMMAVSGPALMPAPAQEPSMITAAAAVALGVAGMAIFSVRLAIMAIYGALLGAGGAVMLGVPPDAQMVSVAAFNAVPSAIALGGYFVVWGGPAFGLVAVATPVVVLCWVLLRDLLSLVSLLPLTGPFCLVTLACLQVLRRQRARARTAGLFVVPLAFAAAPEQVLAWFNRERRVEAYWKRFSPGAR